MCGFCCKTIFLARTLFEIFGNLGGSFFEPADPIEYSWYLCCAFLRIIIWGLTFPSAKHRLDTFYPEELVRGGDNSEQGDCELDLIILINFSLEMRSTNHRETKYVQENRLNKSPSKKSLSFGREDRFGVSFKPTYEPTYEMMEMWKKKQEKL